MSLNSDLNLILNGLMEDLDVTISRTDRIARASTGQVSTGKRVQPLIFNEEASNARIGIVTALASVVRDLVDYYPHVHAPLVNVKMMARWLMLIPGLIEEHPRTLKIEDTVHYAVSAALKVIDRGPDLLFVGVCIVCGQGVYTQGLVARCCDITHETAIVRADMLARVDAMLAPASDIVGLMKANGVELTSDAIRGMHRRKRIECEGMDTRGRMLFRVGAVKDELARRGL